MIIRIWAYITECAFFLWTLAAGLPVLMALGGPFKKQFGDWFTLGVWRPTTVTEWLHSMGYHDNWLTNPTQLLGPHSLVADLHPVWATVLMWGGGSMFFLTLFSLAQGAIQADNKASAPPQQDLSGSDKVAETPED